MSLVEGVTAQLGVRLVADDRVPVDVIVVTSADPRDLGPLDGRTVVIRLNHGDQR